MRTKIIVNMSGPNGDLLQLLHEVTAAKIVSWSFSGDFYTYVLEVPDPEPSHDDEYDDCAACGRRFLARCAFDDMRCNDCYLADEEW